MLNRLLLREKTVYNARKVQKVKTPLEKQTALTPEASNKNRGSQNNNSLTNEPRKLVASVSYHKPLARSHNTDVVFQEAQRATEGKKQLILKEREETS